MNNPSDANPHPKEQRHKRVFISAVSCEFDGLRNLITEAMLDCDHHPVVQTYFDLSDKSIFEKLRSKIASCHAMIHVAGTCFGALAQEPKPGEELVSYTQMEYRIAKELGVKVFVFITPSDFPFLPTPKYPEPPVSEDLAKVAAQAHHRDFLMGKLAAEHAQGIPNQDYFEAANPKEVDQKVRALQFRIEALEQELTLVSEKIEVVADDLNQSLAEKSVDITRSVADVGTKVSESNKGIQTRQSVILAVTLAGFVCIVGVIFLLNRKSSGQIFDTISQLAAIGPEAPVTHMIKTNPSATVLDPEGLKPLGRTPMEVDILAGRTMIVSQRQYAPVWYTFPKNPRGDASIKLQTIAMPTAGQPFTLSLLGASMAWIPSGDFLMGAPDDEIGSNSAERPQHRVRITQGFWLGATEITNRQAALFLPQFSDQATRQPNLPAVGMTWGEAMQYCRSLSRFEADAGRIPPGWEFRLPTEAEWEYACRAGSITRFSTGDAEASLDETAWTRSNSSGRLHPVATRKANQWGLHDLHGNAAEWCIDWFGTYDQIVSIDPTGPQRGIQRCVRGGDYLSLPVKASRSAARGRASPGTGSPQVGFRILLQPSTSETP